MLTNIDAVIFDLDGTMADSMDVWVNIDRRFFESRNMEVPETLAKEIEGMSFTETAEYFVRTFEIDRTVGEVEAIWTRQAMDAYAHEVELKPGILEFLRLLKQKNIRIGIATSNSRELLEVFLNARKIDSFIDASVTATDIKKGKPAPDIYLRAAELLHARPERCLVFEDVPNGILAGKNAGMRTCAVEDAFSAHLWEEKKKLADYYIADYYSFA